MNRPLNLGCGSRIKAGWTNVDLSAASPAVIEWDVRSALPLPHGSVPFAYSSHMLEHLSEEDAEAVAKDVLRVLSPGGIFRVVVPDLERLARWYLEALDSPKGAQLEWARIHLMDQLVRMQSGGRMRSFLRDASDSDFRHAMGRMGSEALACRSASPARPGVLSRWWGSLTRPQLFIRGARALRRRAAEQSVRVLLGEAGRQSFAAAMFASSGERHLWMYDAESLSRLLSRAGFTDVVERDAVGSGWPEWQRENLDVDADGTVYKPDSLYMEGTRP